MCLLVRTETQGYHLLLPNLFVAVCSVVCLGYVPVGLLLTAPDCTWLPCVHVSLIMEHPTEQQLYVSDHIPADMPVSR